MITEKTQRFSDRNAWPPNKSVRKASIGPEGGTSIMVSTRIFVMKVDNNMTMTIKNWRMKEKR
jgi:hypothetical protein